MDNVCNVPLQVFSFLHFHRRYRPAAFVVFFGRAVFASKAHLGVAEQGIFPCFGTHTQKRGSFFDKKVQNKIYIAFRYLSFMTLVL